MLQLRFFWLLAALYPCTLAGVTTPEVDIINIVPTSSTSSETTSSLITDPSTENTKPHTNTTTTSTTPSTTTSTTTSTTPSTTTSTTPSTTTSTTPSTTTSTTPSTTTSTTPSTTTSTPPPPTPKPGPLPPPTQGKWSYNDTNTNVTCVMVTFAAQLNVTYPKLIDNATLGHVLLNVPWNASVVAGSCGPVDQFIKLSWPVENNYSTNSLTITYHKNDTTKSYGLQSLIVELSPDNFINASSAVLRLEHGRDWQTPLATSYRCAPPALLTLNAASGAVAALASSHLQEEAFRATNASTGFSAPRECGGGDVPDAVPIAVGCALGGLVLVVLVAYLVGRRRSAAHGYLSM